jgi:hypothetical protein
VPSALATETAPSVEVGWSTKNTRTPSGWGVVPSVVPSGCGIRLVTVTSTPRVSAFTATLLDVSVTYRFCPPTSRGRTPAGTVGSPQRTVRLCVDAVQVTATRSPDPGPSTAASGRTGLAVSEQAPSTSAAATSGRKRRVHRGCMGSAGSRGGAGEPDGCPGTTTIPHRVAVAAR